MEGIDADSPSLELRHLTADDMTPTSISEEQYAVIPLAGPGWGQCGNITGETLLVYGPKAGGTYDNSLYCLPSGYLTPAGWDCDGFYVPNDRIANQLASKVPGPLAVKYWDFRTFIIEKSGPVEYKCFGNNGAFTPGQINWYIPSVPQIIVAQACA